MATEKKIKHRPLHVLLLCHEDLVPPAIPQSQDRGDEEIWKTEFDVWHALLRLGHEVSVLGVGSDLRVIRKAIDDKSCQIVFNLLEEFDGEAIFDQHVVSYLELLSIPYTGCNPRGLLLARDKALSKKILHFHRVLTPRFYVFRKKQKPKLSRTIRFPLFVKSLTEEASAGISKKSIVYSEAELKDRIEFLHENVGSHALVEEFIEGRELYVSLHGNEHLETMPPWELKVKNLKEGEPLIATRKVKWDTRYQKKMGVGTAFAEDIPETKLRELNVLSKRIYHNLAMSGYGRLDYRMTEAGEIYLLEANPNPNISRDEDFAASAAHKGITYEGLIQKLLTLGLRYDTKRYG